MRNELDRLAKRFIRRAQADNRDIGIIVSTADADYDTETLNIHQPVAYMAGSLASMTTALSVCLVHYAEIADGMFRADPEGMMPEPEDIPEEMKGKLDQHMLATMMALSIASIMETKGCELSAAELIGIIGKQLVRIGEISTDSTENIEESVNAEEDEEQAG